MYYIIEAMIMKNDSFELPEKMDRSIVSYGNQETFEKDDMTYWQNASIEEKLQTITYLRECFYGKKATTGRIKKNCVVFKF